MVAKTVKRIVGLGLCLALWSLPSFAAQSQTHASLLTWNSSQQKYGYRHMEKLFPTHLVKRGSWVRPLPTAKSQISPRWTWDGKSYDVDTYMSAMRTSGVLVLKDGQIALERYGLDRRPSERWTSFSVAKSVTSTLIGAAISDGKIKSLDEPVTTYIPQLAGSAYEGVSVRQLITMTSGVKWNEDYTDPNSDVARAGSDVPEPGINPIVSYMRRLPREAAPGSKFVYKTGETDLAGVLISNAVGQSLSDYLSAKIWVPAGMGRDAIWMSDTAGHERGGCCMSMTLRDYGRLGLFILEGGKIGNRRVVPQDWVSDATTAHVKFAGHEASDYAPDTGYGYFWWINSDGYSAEGIFGQQIFVFPKEHLVIAINSAWPVADNPKLWAAQAAFARAIQTAVK